MHAPDMSDQIAQPPVGTGRHRCGRIGARGDLGQAFAVQPQLLDVLEDLHPRSLGDACDVLSILRWYTFRVVPCYGRLMAGGSERLNVTLDDEYAAKLARLAERTHVQEGTLARSLLSQAIDEADPDAENVVQILDGISGALERAQLGLRQARKKRTIPLDEL